LKIAYLVEGEKKMIESYVLIRFYT